MGLLFRSALALGLATGLGLPAAAQGERCTHEDFAVDGVGIGARICIPLGPAAGSVLVTETFTARGKAVAKITPLTVVSGALTSRTLDNVDLSPLGSKHTLHITLAYRAGTVRLEHVLLLPGAIPVK
jgi:hypothetical protein